MRLLVVADAHVGTRIGDAEAMTDLIDRAVAAGFTEIVWLGDAFQYLIGLSKFWTSSVIEVIGAWDRARAAGVRIVLLEGNRDFFLDEPDLAAHHDGASLCRDYTAAGVRYRLVHGDKVNQRDFQYLFWSRVSKSWPARLWARWLPRRLAVRIVEGMEARLAATNRRYRYTKPVDALRASADATFDDGVDILLWGHFHSLWEYRRAGKLAMVVPAWLETRVALAVEPDGRWWLADQDLRPVDPDEVRDD